MMRNALICAGTMLALLLLWPLVFAGGGVSGASASMVTIPVPPRALRDRAAPGIESCHTTLSRARRLCAPGDAACAGAMADAYDICEVRGRRPD